jgi:DNA-binding NtrC family response regulator
MTLDLVKDCRYFFHPSPVDLRPPTRSPVLGPSRPACGARFSSMTTRQSTDSPAFRPLGDKARASIRILVVDDEATLRDSCVNVLRMQGFDVTSAGRGEEGLELVRRRTFDIMLLDFYMSGVPGLELLRAAVAKRPETIVIMMTGNPSLDASLEALKLGAWDYLPKPFSATHMEILLGRAAHAVMDLRAHDGDGERVATAGDGSTEGPLLGTSPAFLKALDLARKVARSNASVFITGVSGSGKELIAKYIHQHSRRSGKPMVAINCAALPEALLESEMFGHVKGSFTGAVKDKAGLFEVANGGTLFLDELTEMSLRIQAKLLRVIQDGAVRRVGSNQVDAVVDVRFVAAMNRDPVEAVEAGDLRSDLYYRLRVVPIRVPPLRERQEDIGLLATHFLEKYWKRDNSRARPPVFSDSALAALRAYPWPGNVRELQNVVEHTMVLAEPGAEILAEDIPFIAGPSGNGHSGGGAAMTFDMDEEYHVARDRVLAEFEKSYLTSIVTRASGNMSRAARIAGVDRTTLYRLIEKHGLQRDTILRSR